MKTGITLNGKMYIADVRSEKRPAPEGRREVQRYIATLSGTIVEGQGDTTEEAADDLRDGMADLVRKGKLKV